MMLNVPKKANDAMHLSMLDSYDVSVLALLISLIRLKSRLEVTTYLRNIVIELKLTKALHIYLCNPLKGPLVMSNSKLSKYVQ